MSPISTVFLYNKEKEAEKNRHFIKH